MAAAAAAARTRTATRAILREIGPDLLILTRRHRVTNRVIELETITILNEDATQRVRVKQVYRYGRGSRVPEVYTITIHETRTAITPTLVPANTMPPPFAL